MLTLSPDSIKICHNFPWLPNTRREENVVAEDENISQQPKTLICWLSERFSGFETCVKSRTCLVRRTKQTRVLAVGVQNQSLRALTNFLLRKLPLKR